jgi:hypothetical protein
MNAENRRNLDRLNQMFEYVREEREKSNKRKRGLTSSKHTTTMNRDISSSVLQGDIKPMNPEMTRDIIRIFESRPRYIAYRDVLYGCLFSNGLSLEIDPSLQSIFVKNEYTDRELTQRLNAFCIDMLDYILLFGMVPICLNKSGDPVVPPIGSGHIYFGWNEASRTNEYYWVWNAFSLAQFAMKNKPQYMVDPKIRFYVVSRPTFSGNYNSPISKLIPDFLELEEYRRLNLDAENKRTQGQFYLQRKLPSFKKDEFDNFLLYNRAKQAEEQLESIINSQGPQYYYEFQRRIASLYSDNLSDDYYSGGGVRGAYSTDAFEDKAPPIYMNGVEKRFTEVDPTRNEVGALLELVEFGRPPANTQLLEREREFDGKLAEVIVFGSSRNMGESSNHSALRENASLQKSIINNKLKAMQMHVEHILSMAFNMMYDSDIKIVERWLQDQNVEAIVRATVKIQPIVVLSDSMITEIMQSLKETNGSVHQHASYMSMFAMIRILTGVKLDDLARSVSLNYTLRNDRMGDERAREEEEELISRGKRDPHLVDYRQPNIVSRAPPPIQKTRESNDDSITTSDIEAEEQGAKENQEEEHPTIPIKKRQRKRSNEESEEESIPSKKTKNNKKE